MSKKELKKKTKLYPKPITETESVNEDIRPGIFERNPKKGKFAAELRPKKPKT